MSSPPEIPHLLAFDDPSFDGEGGWDDARRRALMSRLGGKAVGLVEMTRLGLSVPPGFILPVQTTKALAAADSPDDELGSDLKAELRASLAKLEGAVGGRFGDPERPLLVSVRSGASVSMPGMMDTVLNVGMTRHSVPGLAATAGTGPGEGGERFAWDVYRRALQMFGEVVLGAPRGGFEDALSRIKASSGRPSMADSELDVASLQKLAGEFEAHIEGFTGAPYPNDPYEQLERAIIAVARSWDNVRSRRFRASQSIPDDLGTACIVQAMVYGNRGPTSGAGVAFTRNPSTGARELYGEYLATAQGEDIVSGTRTPSSLTAAGAVPGRTEESLERVAPEVFAAITDIAARLEAHYRDVQDIEFTVDSGEAYVLQTRSAKRTPEADVRLAVAFAEEGVITREEAIARVNPEGVASLLRSRLPSPDELQELGVSPIAIGLAASPGAATGRIVFDPETAERMAAEGQDVILVRRDTTPEDIVAMKGARGILTAAGGLTSHAAVLSRALGKCCVAGASTLQVDYQSGSLVARPRRGSDAEPITLRVGDTITVDGATGRVYQGALDVVAATTIPELHTLLSWADARRTRRVRANADTPRDVRTARSFGAEGVGLCRTEHMFFADDRLEAIRCVVLAGDEEQREEWVARIEAMQRRDFEEIFEAMDGYPVTIRLLDMPLCELMPRDDSSLATVASALGVSLREARRRAGNRHEINPMIGHRGVRVGMTIPAIYAAQTRAVLSAAIAYRRRGGTVAPELLVPLVAVGEEVRQIVAGIRDAAETVFEAEGVRVDYRIGTMIELPRACLMAGRLAEHVDFFSFGTNDLTQTTFGISRDDSNHFIPAYVDELGVLPHNPFKTLDFDGVGELIRLAVERGRAVRPDLEIGVCGQQGGDARSLPFFAKTGVDYVSCAAERIAVARLAFAQMELG